MGGNTDRSYAPLNDRSLVELIVDKLVVGGRLLIYVHSHGADATRAILHELVTGTRLSYQMMHGASRCSLRAHRLIERAYCHDGVEVTGSGLARFFAVVLPHMDEVQRSVVAGALAEMLGRGGKTAAAEASGISATWSLT